MHTTIAVVSDLHAGSTVGLCPPAPIALDDGGWYHPTAAQGWLWTHWTRYWAAVRHARQERLVMIWNGDLLDGPMHHGNVQTVHPHPNVQFDILNQCLAVPLALDPDAVIVVRGTEAHVGQSAAGEEGVARALRGRGVPIVGCTTTGAASWWHFVGDFGPLRLSATHHGRIGQRPWTRGNVSSNLAAQIFYEHASRKERHPDVAIRSHYHKCADSGDSHPVRVIQTGAWQLASAYAHRVNADSLADISGLIITVEDIGWHVTKYLVHPEPTPAWRME